MDSSYDIKVRYEYDSWGQIVSIKDQDGNDITDPNHIGNINPFRSRSYYYDNETELYYLNSRYYNPQWGRFFSTDNVMCGVRTYVLGHNIYQYAFNNPINYEDSNGNWPRIFKKIGNALKKYRVGELI